MSVFIVPFIGHYQLNQVLCKCFVELLFWIIG